MMQRTLGILVICVARPGGRIGGAQGEQLLLVWGFRALEGCCGGDGGMGGGCVAGCRLGGFEGFGEEV